MTPTIIKDLRKTNNVLPIIERLQKDLFRGEKIIAYKSSQNQLYSHEDITHVLR